MGKTDTIKERRVDVYLDTLERKERWKEVAAEEGESLSKFIQRAVEYVIEQGGPDYQSLGERSQQIQELEQAVMDLRKELKQKDIVIERLEADLRQYRMQPFTEDGFEGVRQYDEELIDILQSTSRITGTELRQRLDIAPTDTDQLKALDQQLQQLEAYGLVSSTSKGWRWTG